MDWINFDNCFQSYGFGKFSEIMGVEPQKMKEILNDIKLLLEIIY